MRKPVFPRILGLIVLYCVLFVLLAAAQFTQRGSFSRRAGAMQVSGKLLLTPAGQGVTKPEVSGSYTLAGRARVFFGGLEFRLEDGDSGILLIQNGGERNTALPLHMVLEGDSVRFTLAGGAELLFSTHDAADGPELRISGNVPQGVSGMEIPVKPQRASLSRDPDSGLMIISYNGMRYQFAGSAQLESNGRLMLPAAGLAAAYRAVPSQSAQEIDPAAYIIPQARTAQFFDDAVSVWKDMVFSQWGRNISVQPDEDMVIAYSGEALLRGSYRAAVAAVPPSFVSGAQQGWQSSVYIGGMNSAFRLFNTAERERSARISRLVTEGSADILTENHLFDFLAVRSLTGVFEQGAELVRSLDAASLRLEHVPGIFEGYTDFNKWRSQEENPFEQFIDTACRLVVAKIRRDNDRVLVFADVSADTVFNLRLGKALREWAAKAGDDDWLGVGRSLTLSVLSLGDTSGVVPAAALPGRNEGGGTTSGGISAAAIYRQLDETEYFPHAAFLHGGQGSVWAWTAAPVSAVQTADALEISASFPAGETHYLMIRGVRPFVRLQLYNTGWRSDPQFERYDSSGWVYHRQEQTLIIKMKHRATLEQVRIIFREEVRPEPPPEAAPAAGAENSIDSAVNTTVNTGTAPYAP
ncbi:MAG: hypothetical protein LBD48_06125 [Treponema sp.]|nr:hypothetical protein [Treponema sp.]